MRLLWQMVQVRLVYRKNKLTFACKGAGSPSLMGEASIWCSFSCCFYMASRFKGVEHLVSLEYTSDCYH